MSLKEMNKKNQRIKIRKSWTRDPQEQVHTPESKYNRQAARKEEQASVEEAFDEFEYEADLKQLEMDLDV